MISAPSECLQGFPESGLSANDPIADIGLFVRAKPMPRATETASRDWMRVIQRVPSSIRITAGLWLIASLVVFIAPDLASDVSPALALFLALPMTLVALGTVLFIFWSGAKTIADTVRSVSARDKDQSTIPRRSQVFIGGLGALQIYMIFYTLTGLWLASLSGTYALSTILSCVLVAGLGYALFVRKPHPSNVKIFLWGGLGVTVLFGLLMATVAVPPR